MPRHPQWNLLELSVPAPGRGPSYRRTGPSGESVLLRSATFRRFLRGEPCGDPVTRPVLRPEGVPNPKKLREAPHPVTFPSSWSRGDSVSSLLRRVLPSRSEDRRGRPSVRSTSSAEAVEAVSACRSSPRRRAARPALPSPASWRGVVGLEDRMVNSIPTFTASPCPKACGIVAVRGLWMVPGVPSDTRGRRL